MKENEQRTQQNLKYGGSTSTFIRSLFTKHTLEMSSNSDAPYSASIYILCFIVCLFVNNKRQNE